MQRTSQVLCDCSCPVMGWGTPINSGLREVRRAESDRMISVRIVHNHEESLFLSKVAAAFVSVKSLDQHQYLRSENLLFEGFGDIAAVDWKGT